MKRWIGLAILALLTLECSQASAQSKGDVELGLDGGVGLAIYGDDDTFVTIGFPAQNLRVGWFAGNRIEIEPSIGYHRFSVSTEPTDPFLPSPEVQEAGTGELALSYHGGGTESLGRVFVKGGGLVLFSGETSSQFGAEAGIGWKQRFENSHWALRIELSLAKTFESSDLQGAWLPALTFGFSHFSK